MVLAHPTTRMKAAPLLFIALALSACGTLHTPPSPELQKSQPTSLDYSTGGFMADYIQITWNSDYLTYTHIPYFRSCSAWDGDHLLPPHASYGGYTRTWKQIIRPNARRWKAFWSEMEAIDVWRWLPDYTPPVPAIDGGQWNLTLSRGAHRVVSGGSNGWPSDDDPRKINENEFKRYSRLDDAMMKLIGRKSR